MPDFLVSPELPVFITFPPCPTTYTIRDSGDYFFLEGVEDKKFDLPSQAHDYASKELNGEVTFNSAELQRAQKTDTVLKGILFESSGRLLISHTRNDRVELLKSSYAAFLGLNEQYKTDPTNWVVAYQWVQQHPAFWHRDSVDSDFWQTDNGWYSKWESVTVDEEGNPSVLIEHGPWHDEKERTQSSHDHRLDTYGSTFEEAFVRFARKVDQYYNIDGSERVGVTADSEPES